MDETKFNLVMTLADYPKKLFRINFEEDWKENMETNPTVTGDLPLHCRLISFLRCSSSS